MAPETLYGAGSMSTQFSSNVGWQASIINTDIESGNVNEFIRKENKWFNYIRGNQVLNSNSVDTSSLNVQGIGIVSGTQFE